MKLSRMTRATLVGAAFQYFFDPTEGQKRRDAARARLASIRERAATMLMALRPKAEQVASVAKERLDALKGDARSMTEKLGENEDTTRPTESARSSDGWVKPDHGRENAATAKGEMEARI